jgi:hypothetical protein
MQSTPEQRETIEQAVRHLPLEIQHRVRAYIESLLNRQERTAHIESEAREAIVRDARVQYTTAQLEQKAQT